MARCHYPGLYAPGVGHEAVSMIVPCNLNPQGGKQIIRKVNIFLDPLSAREEGNLNDSFKGGEKMKKSVLLPVLFLFTFAATFGFVLSFNEEALAGPQCDFACLWELDMSDDTGPECPGNCRPGEIYIIWKKSTCSGGPLNCPNFKVATGCWDGVGPFGCKLMP